MPEVFPDPEALHAWRSWGCTPEKVPSYAEVAADLERIFAQYQGSNGLEIRRRRYLWNAVMPHE